MASIGNFFRRSLRRSGRRGEGREGTPGSTAPRRASGGAGVGAGIGVGVGTGAGASAGAAAAGADGCRRSGDFPGQRSAATLGGTDGTGTGTGTGTGSVPSSPARTRSPCGAQLGPSALRAYRISRGLLHPRGLTPAPGSAPHLPGAHPIPWGFSPSRELHPIPWEPTLSQMSLPHPPGVYPIPGAAPQAPSYHIPKSFPSRLPTSAASQGTPERGTEGIRGGTVPPRQVSVAEP